jgi:hypothetical protein
VPYYSTVRIGIHDHTTCASEKNQCSNKVISARSEYGRRSTTPQYSRALEASASRTPSVEDEGLINEKRCGRPDRQGLERHTWSALAARRARRALRGPPQPRPPTEIYPGRAAQDLVACERSSSFRNESSNRTGRRACMCRGACVCVVRHGVQTMPLLPLGMGSIARCHLLRSPIRRAGS